MPSKVVFNVTTSLASIYSTYSSSKFNSPFCTASDYITSGIQGYPGMAEYRRYLMPALLIAGWFIGCGVMVYVIFS
ncbi:sarcoplasmic/endoplasmic reticulum calcium ATPase regulator DWORF isoform X1 [Bufo bufo]|uniref:sarcoplasmic/endoplasmic reticulum calcium ATPase regulator DWORF isoform X1 n=1 Tax=Bufo bufo TaxID=8384 RepID=UPI001ABDA912|nr:sarcoplasmic/endoplasmic reticulum calcium ATPase regulator DWORF isoform X1 [Bufo bufo]